MEKILIEAVKVRPSLYNVNCVEYKDAKIRDKEWKEVAALVGEPLEKCKNRWKSLRRKARIEMLKPIHKATKITKDWQYLDSLSFLKNKIHLNRTYTGSEEGSNDQPILRAALCNNDLSNKTIRLSTEEKNSINSTSTYNNSTDIVMGDTMGEIENSINDSSIYNTPSTISQYEVLDISNENNEVPRPPTSRALSFNNIELSKENIDSINTSPTYSYTSNISSRLINDRKNSIIESPIHNNPSIMTTFDILEISDDSTDGQDILQAPLFNNDLSETINAFSTFNKPYDTSMRNEKANSIDKFAIYDYPSSKRLRHDSLNSTNESPIYNRNDIGTEISTHDSPIHNQPSDFNKRPKHGNKNSTIEIAQSYNKSLELENKSKDSSEKSTIQSFFKSLGVILKENLNYDEEIEMEEAILATVEQKIKEFKIRKGEMQNAEIKNI